MIFCNTVDVNKGTCIITIGFFPEIWHNTGNIVKAIREGILK